MNINLKASVIFFISSYLPLALIHTTYSIKPKHDYVTCSSLANCSVPEISYSKIAVSALAISALCFFYLVAVVRNTPTTHEIKATDARLVQSDFISYSLPYLVSFIGLDLGSPQKIIGFALFLTILFITQYKSGQLILNPLLIALDWKLYEIKVDYGSEIKIERIISKRSLSSSATIAVSPIGNILIDKSNDN